MSILGRALQRFYPGLEPFGGFRLAPINGVKNADVTRPTMTWGTTNPPTHSEVNGSVYLCTAATSTEDVWWHREGGAWVKQATLSDLLLPVVSDVTISAGGAATLTQAAHTLRGAGAVADDLDTISGMTATEVAFLVCGAEAITVRDASVGAGNIATPGNASLVLAAGDVVMAILSGTTVSVLPVSIAAGLPVSMQAVTRGRLLRGSSAGRGEELDVHTADAVPIGNGTDVTTMALPTTGLVAKTAAGACAGRSIAVGSASLTVSNPDGVAGNPTLDTAQDIRTTASPTFAGMTITGDLLVSGDSIIGDCEHVDLEANFVLQNLGYTTAVAVTGGRVVNYLPTATVDTTVAAGVFTPGVLAASDPTVTTAGAATFAANDLVMISGAADPENDGIYEVVSHAANLLTVRSTAAGVTPRVEAFTNDQFVANAGDVGCSLTKVTVAVDRAGTDGKFEAAKGAVTPLVYSDYLLASDLGSAVQAWDADLDALAALDATAGILVKTAANTYARRTITAPAAGITVADGSGAAGNPTLALANDLAAVEGLAGTGLAARTAADTWAQRSIAGTVNEIEVTNPDGVAGNPTLRVGSHVHRTADEVFAGGNAAAGHLNTAPQTVIPAPGNNKIVVLDEATFMFAGDTAYDGAGAGAGADLVLRYVGGNEVTTDVDNGNAGGIRMLRAAAGADYVTIRPIATEVVPLVNTAIQLFQRTGDSWAAAGNIAVRVIAKYHVVTVA